MVVWSLFIAFILIGSVLMWHIWSTEKFYLVGWKIVDLVFCLIHKQVNIYLLLLTWHFFGCSKNPFDRLEPSQLESPRWITFLVFSSYLILIYCHLILVKSDLHIGSHSKWLSDLLILIFDRLSLMTKVDYDRVPLDEYQISLLSAIPFVSFRFLNMLILGYFLYLI